MSCQLNGKTVEPRRHDTATLGKHALQCPGGSKSIICQQLSLVYGVLELSVWHVVRKLVTTASLLLVHTGRLMFAPDVARLLSVARTYHDVYVATAASDTEPCAPQTTY